LFSFVCCILNKMAEETVAASALSGRIADTAHLAKQDLSALEISKLTPLSPEVISRQATINIGTRN
jgi:hypothetical protein